MPYISASHRAAARTEADLFAYTEQIRLTRGGGAVAGPRRGFLCCGGEGRVHRWVEHTSEIELSVEAESREAVFREAAVALGELIDGAGSEPASRQVSVRATDLPALLAAWLEELVFVAETEGIVPEDVEGMGVGPGEARGLVRGHRGPPQTLVKAVTYHRLAMEPAPGGWRARVVFDV